MTQESGFSGKIDHWGLASTDLKLHSSTTTPHPKGSEDARDQDGNMADRGYYVGGPGTPVECVYKLVSGSLDLSTLAPVGLIDEEEGAQGVITGITVDTENGDWPTITVPGILYADPDSDIPQFTLPAITIVGKKRAQALGFAAVGSAARLQSSSLSLEGEIEHVLADKDTVGNVAFSGALLTVTANVLRLSGAPTVTAVSPIASAVNTQSPTSSGGITDWAEGSFEFQLHRLPDA